MPRVEFLEKVWGPGPGEEDAVFKRSGRRYRVGQVEDFDDAAFEVLERDVDPKAFKVVGDDTALRARKAETVVENQHRTLAQVDPDMSGAKIEQKHLAKKMTDDVAESQGITKKKATPKKRAPKKKTASRDTGGMDVKSMRAEILGA